MCSNQNLLSGLYLRDNDVVPVGSGSFNGQLEGLEHGELFGLGLGRVSRVFDDDVVVGMFGVHGGWGDIEGPAPDLEIFLLEMANRVINKKMGIQIRKCLNCRHYRSSIFCSIVS